MAAIRRGGNRSRATTWPLALVVAISVAGCAKGAGSSPSVVADSAPVGPGAVVDGFPLGPVLDCGSVVDCTQEYAIADAALNTRLPSHAPIVTRALYAEDLGLLSPPASGVLRVRSGTLHVVVYTLSNGTVAASGVYCGPAGCYGLATYPPVQP